ncbi:MAG: prepilin-type N-terminal cleavage/methylation domain-containing protein [Synergistaceae bacterium]|nr:prepilin-type N-terminal cleavage/methylation domain-containing protein [Synergistaceae bacterium]
MKRSRADRSKGFTLVELLIVIIIIGIFTGIMFLIVSGDATDGAKAAKVVNDLRALKTAALMLFFDEHEWPSESNAADAAKSLDRYTNRSIFDGPEKEYDLHIVVVSSDTSGGETTERVMLGIKPPGDAFPPGVIEKIKVSAPSSGAYMRDYPPYGVDNLQTGFVYMYMK